MASVAFVLADGLSENITVRSIVGRYLEHGRVYAFANGGRFGSPKNTLFMSGRPDAAQSAAPGGNVCPAGNPTVRKQVINQILTALLQDERNSWFLMPDGSYRHPEAGLIVFPRMIIYCQPKPVGRR